MVLTEQQNNALNEINSFIENKDFSIFILRGYAGTGKTTMIKQIFPEIEKKGKKVTLMAPTGRAAKVLREKTGFPTSTIHRGIYAFENMKAVRHDEQGNLIITNHTKNDAGRSKGSDDLQFWFSIIGQEPGDDPSKNVYIIDEASMISSRPTCSETLHFGTDVLLDDLLTYVQPHLGSKVIFVGDPAQLPPVGDNCSQALSESYFEEKGLNVKSFDLTEVLRQDGCSVILKNAMKLRNLLNEEKRNELVFDRKEGEVSDINSEDLLDRYFNMCPIPEIGNTIAICFTNSLVKEYNDAMRRRYFPENDNIVAGDILQIVRNNVNNALNIQYFNGDFVKVLEVSDKVETMSAPVWTDVEGERERIRISLDFRDVVLLSEDGNVTTCKIVDSLLNSRSANLSPLENVALYINFKQRHPNLKENEEAFKETLMADPYFNAIQAKYGYAITCHKSQGGEWNAVFVDYTGRTGLNNDCLRWMYTATTRASKVLYGVHMPNITPLTTLKFNEIKKITKPSKEAFAYRDIGEVTMLPSSAQAFQKQKYANASAKLSTAGYIVSAVQCVSYDDKYTIETPYGSIVYDCYYNSTGTYTRIIPQSIIPENDIIIGILQDEYDVQYDVQYKPSNDTFKKLYNLVGSICDDMLINISNIVEHTQQYYVAYYLKTSGKFSLIQFYFNSSGFLTHAIPSSDLGAEDLKLKELITSIQSK